MPAAKKSVITPQIVDKVLQVLESMFIELEDFIADYKVKKAPKKFPNDTVISMLKKVSKYLDTSKMKPEDLKTNIFAGNRIFFRVMGILNRASGDSAYAKEMHEDLEALAAYMLRLTRLMKKFK